MYALVLGLRVWSLGVGVGSIAIFTSSGAASNSRSAALSAAMIHMVRLPKAPPPTMVR